MKVSAPNNYPREGEHNTVTASQITRLEQHRDKLNNVLTYTLGEDAQVKIQAAAHAAGNYEYTRGHQILSEASQTIRRDVNAALEPARLDMELIKQEAREHLNREFQTQSQALAP
ncbi:hypothetical protein VWY06_01965 [Phaeobacter sp. JH20_10]|uniref:hypothetical protein n=1 Tax=Phaeobacter sp. JH20_10 TaxID=3112469 RepID=UPI003A84EF34